MSKFQSASKAEAIIKTKALMFQGTGSDVGKTVLVAGLCRAAWRRGLRVAPFKPQNMSNNAAVAECEADGSGGGEIGRGQWLQAMACGVAPSVHMNPILLKPQSEIGSQIVVQGKVTGSAKAREYQSLKPTLLAAVMESFEKVSRNADLVIVEGAGSPAEINLRDGDIANMGFAGKARLPVVLIGDIDRGGVIASLVGTHTILPQEDRDMIAGFLINKFRGDVSLFDKGLQQITRFTGWRSFGVLPWLDAVRMLPAEDSVGLDNPLVRSAGIVKIVVPVMGKIANFDDFDALKHDPDIELVFVRKGERLLGDTALIVLAGSKSTIADLIELRANGWEADIKAHLQRGGELLGICGGYQMLGQKISDPNHVEGDVGEIDGLGFLDVTSVLEGEKITRNSRPHSAEYDVPLEGYEIHMGRTSGPDCSRPMIISDNGPDGAISVNGKVRGCYLHGLFNGDGYRSAFLARLGIAPTGNSYRQSIENALDELAEHMEKHLDIDGLLKLASAIHY